MAVLMGRAVLLFAPADVVPGRAPFVSVFGWLVQDAAVWAHTMYMWAMRWFLRVICKRWDRSWHSLLSEHVLLASTKAQLC